MANNTITPLPWLRSGKLHIKSEKQHYPHMQVFVCQTPQTKAEIEGEFTDFEAEANAAYIVKCCNAFPAMLRALHFVESAAGGKLFPEEIEAVREAVKIAEQ